MNLRAFYHFDRGPTEVPSTAPRHLSSEGVCASLLPLLVGEDDYIGLLDDADNLLQIIREPQSMDYWIELPQPEDRLSYGQRLSAQSLMELLAKLPSRFRPHEFPSFRRRHWATWP